MESVLSGVEPARRRVCAIASAKAFSIVLEPSIRNVRESVSCEGIGSSIWLNLAWKVGNWKRKENGALELQNPHRSSPVKGRPHPRPGATSPATKRKRPKEEVAMDATPQSWARHPERKRGAVSLGAGPCHAAEV